MSYEDFEKSMDRILAFYAAPKRLDGREELTRYMQSLYQSVKRINGAEFERVCQIVADELSPIKKPVPAHFHSAYARVKPNLMKSEQSEGSPAMTRPESDAWIMRRIPYISPVSMQGIIKNAEKNDVQWSPHVAAAILEQAGKDTETWIAPENRIPLTY